MKKQISEELYRIELPYICFGLIAENDKIIKTPPITNWTKNKNIFDIIKYYIKKGAKIERRIIYDKDNKN